MLSRRSCWWWRCCCCCCRLGFSSFSDKNFHYLRKHLTELTRESRAQKCGKCAGQCCLGVYFWTPSGTCQGASRVKWFSSRLFCSGICLFRPPRSFRRAALSELQWTKFGSKIMTGNQVSFRWFAVWFAESHLLHDLWCLVPLARSKPWWRTRAVEKSMPTAIKTCCFFVCEYDTAGKISCNDSSNVRRKRF